MSDAGTLARLRRRPLGRLGYVIAGLVLFAVKYPLDLTVAKVFDEPWGPLSYVSPRLTALTRFADTPELWGALLAVALPFIAMGTWLTLRRLSDVGTSPAWALLFFVPFLNFVFFAILAVLPGQRAQPKPQADESPFRRGDPVPTPTDREPLLARIVPLTVGNAWLVSTLVTLSFTLATVWMATVESGYALLIFTLLPVLNGVVVAAAVTYRKPTGSGAAIGYAFGAALVWAAALVATSLESLGCLVMLIPFVTPMILVGAVIGISIGRSERGYAANVAAIALLILVPATAAAGALVDGRVRPVETVVHIDAPPMTVWREVVAFPPIEEPIHSPFFSLGYPVPMAATIEGSGPGALRRCIFNQGEFVEPITKWDPGRHLAFDVSAQPEAVPHWLAITRGEFVLEENADGSTTLRGRTYYRARIEPERYWARWIEWGLREVHLRVLKHIAERAERPTTAS